MYRFSSFYFLIKTLANIFPGLKIKTPFDNRKKSTYALKITNFRCKNNAQDIGTRCNFNIFAAGVSKLVFRIWNENKKLKYSGFVSERQEKICVKHIKANEDNSLLVCIYDEEKDT